MGTCFCENSRSSACLRTITIHINYHMHFSNQVKHDSPDNDSSVMFRDSCISELPTQASFEVASRSVIQVPPDISSDDRDDGEDDSDEPPVKRVYTETNANGSSGISKLVEFCSKDIKYVASLVFWVSQLKTHCLLLSDVILCCRKNVTTFLKGRRSVDLRNKCNHYWANTRKFFLQVVCPCGTSIFVVFLFQ